MATTYKYVDLGIPSRGINTDTSPSQLGSAHCTYANNVILSEPGHIRTRLGWTAGASHASRFTTPANGSLYGVAVYRNSEYLTNVLLHMQENDNTWEGGSTAGTAKPTLATLAASGVTVSTPDATAFSKHVPFSQYAMYNGSVYFIGDDLTSGNPTRLCRWRNASAADITAGGITINNGSTSGTLGTSVGATQLGDGRYLCVTGGATGPLAGYRYVYPILSGTGTTITLEDAYGYGENTTNVPNAVAASTTIAIRAITEVPNCPDYGRSVAVFRDRLFVCGGNPTTTNTKNVANVLKWCSPGEPEKWPTSNTAYLGDENDWLTAFANVPNGLLIMSANKTFLLTGYDEDSFTITQVSGQIGCSVPASVCYWNNRAYWMSYDGVYTSSGGTPVSLTQPAPGVGTKALYLSMFSGGIMPGGSAAVVGDNLHVAFQTTATGVKSLLTCDLRTGAWSEWGSATDNYNPVYFARSGTDTWGIGVWNTVNVTDCFAPESSAATNVSRYDAEFTSAGSSTTSVIQAEVQFGDVRIGNDTMRLRRIQVEHNCQYFNATSSPRVAWALTLDTDSDIDTTATAVGNVNARYVGNVTTPYLGRYYTDTFTTSSVEAATFRVRLVKTADTASAKLYRVKLVMDPQPVATGRVDNATL